MILSGSPFDCDWLVALLSVTLPGSRVCIVVRWYNKYIMYVSYLILCYVQLHALCMCHVISHMWRYVMLHI